MIDERYVVEVRDRSLARLGRIAYRDLDFEHADLFNDVGTWSLKIRADHPLAGTLRSPGAGIVVSDESGEVFSGPAIKPEQTETLVSASEILVSGVTDDVILADTLTYPQPSNDNPATQNVSHDVREGNAESVMHGYVRANIGTAAPESRRKAGLTAGRDGGRGGTIKKSSRFDTLLELLKGIAATTNLGFRVIQRGTGLRFETYVVADRQREIRLAVHNGSLAQQKVAISAPSATRIVLGGKGEDVDRFFELYSSPDSLAAESAWGRRIEQFMDNRGGDDEDEHEASAQEALATALAQSTAIQLTPADSTTMRFGKDWFLGDRVSVDVEGQELPVVVSGSVLKINSEGIRHGATIGDPTGFRPEGALERTVSTTTSRVAALERNVETSGIAPGVIWEDAGASPPPGWLACDGQAVSRAEYAGLFARIGTRYGAGDGTTTFNVPNRRGRVGVGLDASQAEFNTLGKTYGAKTHTLSVAELPDHTHALGGHTYNWGTNGGNVNIQNAVAAAGPATGNRLFTLQGQWDKTGGAFGAASTPHNNVQPSIAMNYIIKT